MNSKLSTAVIMLLLFVSLAVMGCTSGESGSASAADVTKISAKNVIYDKTDPTADVVSDNIQDATTESNVDIAKIIVGRWNVTCLGYNPSKSGVVNFKDDGTYSIESGYFEAGGSWSLVSSGTSTGVGGSSSTTVTSGTYTVNTNVIAFTYTGWDPATVSRFGVVIYKNPVNYQHLSGPFEWS